MTKILLVDDDDALAGVLHDALIRFGYEVVRAHNGKEALQLYDPQTIQLVLTDLFMPDMDGMELIMQLEQLNPGVRIIAMSGGGMGKPGIHLPLAERLGAVKTLASSSTGGCARTFSVHPAMTGNDRDADADDRSFVKTHPPPWGDPSEETEGCLSDKKPRQRDGCLRIGPLRKNSFMAPRHN